MRGLRDLDEEPAARREEPAAPPSPALPPSYALPALIGNQAFTALVAQTSDERTIGAPVQEDTDEIVDARGALLRQPEGDGDAGVAMVEPPKSAPAGGSGAPASPPAAPPVTAAVPAKIRGTATPASMAADRIPPRVGTTIHIDVNGVATGGPPVKLSVEGAGGGNGTVKIDGAATKDLTASADVTLTGGDQTTPGKAGGLKLVAKQGTTTLASSGGFSVSSIPQNWTCTFKELITGTSRGFVVKDRWESDSGSVPDLDETEISELVEVTSSTGTFAGTGKRNSGYLAGNAFTEDQHGTPVSILKGAGKRIAEQTSMFKDKRTGANDIPVAKSGYTVVRDVVDKGGGSLEIETHKAGASTTANGVTSDAGAGTITKKQAV
jgi:hypothetical protein